MFSIADTIAIGYISDDIPCLFLAPAHLVQERRQNTAEPGLALALVLGLDDMSHTWREIFGIHFYRTHPNLCELPMRSLPFAFRFPERVQQLKQRVSFSRIEG